MLSIKNLNDKSYDDRMAEALMEIPLYSKEWTNFNASDPGITILELLSGFETIQQDSINTITPDIKRSLLKLVGFESKKGRCARVLLKPENLTEAITLPANQVFKIGDISFETNRIIETGGCNVIGIECYFEEKMHDFSDLLNRKISVPTRIFGENPEKGDAVYFKCDNLPAAQEEIIFYVSVNDNLSRNPFDDKGTDIFAKIVWECYTVNGYEEMKVNDHSACFLADGEIRMKMPESEAAVCGDVKGEAYVIRARLEESSYDIAPEVDYIAGFLFEAWQKQSLSMSYTFNKPSQVNLYTDFFEEGYVLVFGKEKKGESYYRYYENNEEEEGRFYEVRSSGYGMNSIVFNKKKYGYAPEAANNAVKVVIFSEEVSRKYELGKVLGYDNQVIELPYQNIVSDGFSLIARRVNENGEYIYDFLRPGYSEANEFAYHLLTREGKVVIEDAGRFIGADLFICGLSLTLGENGNIRPGNKLRGEGIARGITFYNPGVGTGGSASETINDVRKRFIEDIKKPYALVTERDYEETVKNLPKLCIHKVKAFADAGNNRVCVVVKPYGTTKTPKLSDTYVDEISKTLSEMRLLSTRVDVLQPVYCKVNVYATVYVKRHYDNVEEKIREVISEKIDYIENDKNFGEMLNFDDVFCSIEQLECVDYCFELVIKPDNSSFAQIKGNDLIPNDNCLFYPGKIVIETVNR